MKKRLAFALLPLLAAGIAVGAQTVVVNDPTANRTSKPTAAEERIFREQALPAARKAIDDETCEEEIEIAGVARGAFTRAGSRQSLLFYQFCQTGNGWGYVGLVLIEGDSVAANYIADAGWSGDIGKVPDINRNGLDEFVLVYMGGMHQGQGGVGADLMEFAGNVPQGLGWYQAEAFSETDPGTAWKLTAKPGLSPTFFRQRFKRDRSDKWRPSGSPAPFKLKKIDKEFKKV